MKKLHRITAGFFLILVFAGDLTASPALQDSIFPLTSYIHYGEEQGLTTKTVYSIIQDNEGFIWMGTDAGVFRFDGKKFKRFTTKDGITDNEVLSLYQDKHHRVWFLTFNGHLSFWKEGKIYNPENTPFLKDAYTGGIVRTAFEDKRGRLWLGTEQKAFILINGDDVKIIEVTHSGRVTIPSYIHEDSEGGIWSFIDRNKMFKLFVNNFLDTIYLPSSEWLYSCYKKNNNEIFYTSTEGVFKIKDGMVHPFINSSELPSCEKINNIVSDNDLIWICTSENGCYEYKNGRFIRKYLESATITSVLKDREGNLWFSEANKGVLMLPVTNNLVTSFNQSTGLSGEKVISIARGKDNSIWMGYNNGMVDCISNNRKRAYKLYGSDKKVFRVTSLLVDSEITWCGTDVGIFLIQNEKVRYLQTYRYDGVKTPFSVKRVFKDAENRVFCTTNSNLMEVRGSKVSYSVNEVIDQNIRTFAGIEYKKDDFIISTMTGLLEYIPGKKSVEYKTDVDFSSIRVLDMKSDDDHNIVLATTGGLYTMQNGKILQHFSEATGLSDDNCNRVYISGDHMYVSTSNGLNVLERKDKVWSISEIKTIQNGLLSNSINDVVVNNNNIYAATNDGLSVISETDSAPDIYIGQVSVTELSTDSAFSVSGNNYSFKGDIPRLLIRFAYPVFNPVNVARIKYRLLQNETDNPNWHYSQNNAVEFSSLNPGNYIFQLKPDLKEAVGLIITNFNFVIKPLWWQTVTAKICFSLAVVGFVALFFAQRIKRRYEFRVASLKQMNMLVRERNRIASDMHDDIGADLTQISMMANFAKVSKDKKDEFIGKIAETSNEVLKKIDHIIWTLDSAHDYLPDLIYFIHEGMSKYLESSGINFRFESEGEMPGYKIDAIKRRNIFLVVKELVHNSVKHSGATRIEIKVYFSNNKLHVVYEENGKGYTINEVTPGLGHTTLRNRMEEIDSTLEMTSAPGKGVTAHLIIPVSEDAKDAKLVI